MKKRQSYRKFAWGQAARRGRAPRGEGFAPVRRAPARAGLLFGTALGVSIAVFAASAPTRALAADECGVNTPGSTVVNCTPGIYPGGITYPAGDDLSVVLPGSSVVMNGVTQIGSGSQFFYGLNNTTVVNTGAAGVTVVSSDGPAFAQVHDVAVSGGSAVVVVGASYAGAVVTGLVQSDTQGLTVVGSNGGALFLNNGTVDVNGAGALTGAVVIGNNGNVNAFNNGQLNVDASGDATGLTAIAPVGDLTVVANGVIDIDSGEDGVGVLAVAPTGHTTITGGGVIDVYSTGLSAVGVSVYGGPTDTGVDITLTGDITVEQTTMYAGGPPAWYFYQAAGVQVVGVNGPVNIDVGDVTATGYVAQGIVVAFGPNPANPIDVEFDNIVVNSGGGGGHGVFIYGAAGGQVTVSGGAITTTGDYSDGVNIGGGGGIAGDTSVTVGTITTDGYNADGVHVGGHYDIDVSTNSITVSGVNSAGIEVYTDGGDVTVVIGSIDATGVNGAGIVAGSDTGDVDVRSYGRIDSSATGISADSNSGDVFVGNWGPIYTNDAYAYGVIANADDGFANIYNFGGIDTDGNGADAINVYGYDGVSVTSFAVSTDGAFADGIHAESDDGNVVVNSGYAWTNGDYADGIYAYADAGDVTVAANSVTTFGYESVGIHAVSDSGSVTVTSYVKVDTAGDYAHGVWAEADEGDVTVNIGGVVETSGYEAIGVYAQSDDGLVTVSVGANGDISTEGDYAHGIYAYSDNGDVDVDSDGDVHTEGYAAIGILAVSDDGTVTVDSSGAISTEGDYAYGVQAVSEGGAVIVSNTGSITTGGEAGGYYAHGVDAYSEAGDVSVYNTGESSSIVTNGQDARGINAESDEGDVYVLNEGQVVTSGDSASGIFVVAGSFGDPSYGYAHVENDGSVITNGEGSVGIFAGAWGYNNAGSFYGGASIDNNNLIETFGDGATGAMALSFYGGSSVENDGDIVTYGEGAGGVVAFSFADGVSVDNDGDIVTLGDDSIGVLATSVFDDVTVTGEGGVTTWGYDSDGVVAISLSGDGAVYVGMDSVTTDGDYSTGVLAQATGGSPYGGEVDVHVGSVSTSGDSSAGILAYADYDVTVIANSVTTTGERYYDGFSYGPASHGIVAESYTGAVTITAGSVETSGDYALGISAGAGFLGGTYGDVTIEVDQVTTSGTAAHAVMASAAQGDVYVTVGDVTTTGAFAGGVFAYGRHIEVTVEGDVDAQGDDGVHVDSSVWSTVTVEDGASVYSAAGDAIHIDTGGEGGYVDNYGVISAGEGYAVHAYGAAAHVYNHDDALISGGVSLTGNADLVDNDGEFHATRNSFFGGGADTFLNGGVTSVNGNVTFDGLEVFDNDGEITMQDGAANDRFDLGDAVVTSHSLVSLDVNLAGAGTADLLIVGDAAGVAHLDINFVGSATAALGQQILLVDSLSNETGAEVDFPAGPADMGWITYDLAFQAGNDNWYLVSAPDSEVFEALKAGAASQDYWHKSADAWAARMRELRDSQAVSSPTRGEGLETWVQVYAGGESFNEARVFDVAPTPYAANLSVDVDWGGVQLGMDGLWRHGTGSAWWGLTTGYLDYDSEFTADGNRFEINGFNVGGYAGATWGGFFAEALVKGDFYEVEADFNTLPLRQTFDGDSWGARGDFGWRTDFQGLYFEPSASLAWVTSDLDGFSGLGADVDYGDASGLRGRIGARIGTETEAGSARFSPYLGLYAIEDFDGDNEMVFSTGPASLSLVDEARGGWGQAEFGVNVLTVHGLEGFVEGSTAFGGDADGYAARIGARWRW